MKCALLAFIVLGAIVLGFSCTTTTSSLPDVTKPSPFMTTTNESDITDLDEIKNALGGTWDGYLVAMNVSSIGGREVSLLIGKIDLEKGEITGTYAWGPPPRSTPGYQSDPPGKEPVTAELAVDTKKRQGRFKWTSGDNTFDFPFTFEEIKSGKLSGTKSRRDLFHQILLKKRI